MLGLVGTGLFEIAVSVALVLEYEAVLHRHLRSSSLTKNDVRVLLDYLCEVAVKQQIYFLWRPALRDPTDDMILELAVAARCDSIVTFNVSDFEGSEAFGVAVKTPREILETIGELP